ncbi:AAA family ATPase [Mycoplasma sp. HF14]
MKCEIKHLFLQNFKGVEFYNSTDISTIKLPTPLIKGGNGIGKTTVLDAVCFMLTGRDLLGRKLNPQNVNNTKTPVAELTIQIDSKPYILSYKNKNYFINDAEIPARKYFDTISALLKISQKYLLALISPAYFYNLSPKEKREVFMQVFAERYGNDFENSLTEFLELKKFQWLRRVEFDIAQVLTNIRSDIKKIQQSLIISGVPKQLAEELEYFATHPEHQWGPYVASYGPYIKECGEEIAKEREEKNIRLEELDRDLIAYQLVSYKWAEYINKHLQQEDKVFEVSFINEEKGKEELTLKYKNINVLELNTASRLEIGIQLSLLFSKIVNFKGFILLDDAEHIDGKNLKEWSTKYNQQILITKVES